MNAQFQGDIKLLHKMKKKINADLAKGDISIEMTNIRDSMIDFIWERRRSLLEQLKKEKFNICTINK